MTQEIDIVDTLIEVNRNSYSDVVDKAQSLIDAYWFAWKEENKHLAELRAVERPSDEKIHTGRLAPRLYKKHANGKVYIEWYDWISSPLRKAKRQFGVRIKMPASGYSWATVRRNANSWEKQFFDKYEPKLSELRMLVDLLHEQHKTLTKAKNKLNIN